MDYHSMKRSELQKLCKEHKIPANSANSVLADKLSALLNEKQKPRGRQRTCIKSSVETVDESESAASRRKAKKVRFSPEIDYERSGKKVDNVNTVADSDVQIPVKLTRSRAKILGKDDIVPTNERKQGRKAIKRVEKETIAVKESEGNIDKITRSKANAVEKESEPVKETAVVRARVTRSKVQVVTEDSKDHDLVPQVKKKSGRRTEKDEEKVVPSKEVKAVPVRVTRSRGQSSNNESVVAIPPVEKKRTRRDDDVIANPPIEKKRTRRETMVADLSHNEGGHGRRKKRSEERVAEVSETQDNADKGTRQSRRKKANVEDSTVLNQNESKVETVSDRKVTRSKAPQAKKSSGGKGNGKTEVQRDSKTVQQLEEPAVRKNVNRRKSVIQPKITKVVLPLEEPVNVSPKKDTRRKSVVQKAQGKEKKKPLAVKREIVKETEMPVSHNVKTVGEKRTKAASGNEMKAVASGSGSHKSRKRRGDPIIEDQTIETEPVSIRKNSVAKKEQASGVKTPASRKRAMSGNNRSNKRANLSGTKQSDSEDNAEKSGTMGTPISKMANLDLDDKVVETEQTPAIDESGRRFTRGAIRSNRKEPSQSVIKQQTSGAARFSSHKSPGRFTRSGIKIDEKKQLSESSPKSQPLDDAQLVSPEDAEAKSIPDETIEVPSEVFKEANAQILNKVDEKKQPSELCDQSQPLDDAQIVFPEDAEAKSIPNETIAAPSEVSQEDNAQILEQSGDILSASEKTNTMGTPISKMANLELDDKVIETEQTPAIDQSGRRFTRGATRSNRKEPSQSVIKQQTTGATRLSSRKTPGRFTRSGIKVVEKEQPSKSTHQSQPLDYAEMASPEDAEAKSGPAETIAVPSEVSKEANAQILEQSGDLLASESVMFATIDALSDGSHVQNQNEEVHVKSAIVSEAEVQVAVKSEKAAIPEISEKETELTKSGSTSDVLENIVRVGEPFVSAVKTVVIEESVEISLEHSDIKGKTKEDAEDYSNIEDEKASNQKHGNVADIVDAMGMDSVKEGDDVETNREDTHEPFTGDDKLQGLNDIEDEKDTAPENVTTHSEPEKEFDAVEAEKEPPTDTESSTAQIEPANEVDSDVVPSTGIDAHEILIFGKSDDEDEGAGNIKEHESNTNDQDGKSEQEQVTDHYSSAMEEQHVGDDEPEPVQNEDLPVLHELSNNHEQDPLPELPKDSFKSTDQKPVPAVSLAVDEVSCDTVDASKSKYTPQSPAMEESIQETNMDSLTSYDGLENEQKATRTSEFDEDIPSKESESVPLDTSNEQRAEESELATDNDVALVKEKEQRNNDIEDYSNHDVAQENPTIEESSPAEYMEEEATVGGLAGDQLPGDLGAYGSPTTEDESPIDDTVSDPPTSFKNKDRNDQDWGNYSFGSDVFQKPVSANKNGQSMKDPADANATEEFLSWSDSQTKTQVTHVKDGQQSTGGFDHPDKDDETEGSATEYQESSLKYLFKTPATTQVSRVKETQQSTVRFAFPDEDNTEVKAPQDPDSSLLKTPATTQASHVKDRELLSTHRFAFPDKGNAPPNPDSSLKKLFATPAATTGSHVHQQSTIRFAPPVEVGNAPPNPDLSLKALFETPATTQASHVKDHPDNSVRFALPGEDYTENKAAQIPDSSLKKLFTTAATARASSHVKDPQEGTNSYQGNTTENLDPSLKTMFATPATAHVTQQSRVRFALHNDLFGEDNTGNNATQNPTREDRQESRIGFALPNEDDTKGNAAQDPDSSLLKTPATAQASHVKEHQQSRVRSALPDEDGKATHDPDSSLKSLFATPAAATGGRVSHVNDSQQSRVRYAFHDDMFDQGRKQGEDAPQHQGLGGDRKSQVINFEDFSNNFFGDEEEGDYGSGDNSGKDQADEMKQYDLSAGTSRHDASGFKHKSAYSDVFVKNEETKLQDSETGDEDSSLKALFKTPGTTRMSHVKGSERRQNPGGVVEDPKSVTFEDFARDYFGDDDDDDKDGHFEFKQEAAAGTGEGTPRDD